MKDFYTDSAERMAKKFIAAAEEISSAGGFCMFFPHRSVDGDCIGSASAMTSAMRALGCDAYVAMPEQLPEFMQFMDVDEFLAFPWDIPDFKTDKTISGKKWMGAYAVDCSESSRMGVCGEFFDMFDNHLIVDHHESVTMRSDNFWICPEASSACELCYYVISKMEEITCKDLIDKRCAECLMVGMVTDTGRFTFRNTLPETLISAGELMEKGASVTDVCYNLFDRSKKENFLLSAEARSRVEFYADGRFAITVVPRELFIKYGAGPSGVDDVVSKMRDIDGVELAVVLRELEGGEIRGNVRSKTDFDCTKLASQFGGGGHMRASGLTVKDRDIYDLKDAVIKAALELL